MNVKYQKLRIVVWSMESDVHGIRVCIIIQIGERWHSLYSGDTVRTISLLINLDHNSHVCSMHITPEIHTLLFFVLCVFNYGLPDAYVL